MISDVADLVQEESADEIEDDTPLKDEVFVPDPRGLDSVIEVLAIYQNNKKNEKMDSDILSFIADQIYKNYKASTTFMIKGASGNFDDLFNGHLITRDGGDINKLKATWNDLKSDRIESWKNITVPQFKDETLQDSKNEYIYPFFEGLTQMGLVVVSFSTIAKREDAGPIEIILESARAIYLDRLGAGKIFGGVKSEYKEEKPIQEKEGGFFGKLFGKKAS